MKSHLIVGTAVVFAIATIFAVPSRPIQARPDDDPTVGLFSLDIKGIQADSSSPFILRGEPIGSGVWHRLAGPALSNTFAMIPSVTGATPAFDGAGCQAEYTQDEIVAEDGSTLTVNVYGLRCQPEDASGAAAGSHSTIGVYSILRGTGRFQDVTIGAGSIEFDAHADGSTVLHIVGSGVSGRGRSRQ